MSIKRAFYWLFGVQTEHFKGKKLSIKEAAQYSREKHNVQKPNCTCLINAWELSINNKFLLWCIIPTCQLQHEHNS